MNKAGQKNEFIMLEHQKNEGTNRFGSAYGRNMDQNKRKQCTSNELLGHGCSLNANSKSIDLFNSKSIVPHNQQRVWF